MRYWVNGNTNTSPVRKDADRVVEQVVANLFKIEV